MPVPTSSSQVLPRNKAGDLVPVAIVLVIASVFAASMLVNYAANPGELWYGFLRDRNSHFGGALRLAVALQNFNLPRFLALVAEARIWGPVADIALALVMIFGGIDVKLAILPSLIGWICTMVLVLLIARRLFSARWTGNVAGALAVTFALASPAFRLIGADVMLEGPGAGLTAFCLYAYIRARSKNEGESERWWGVLAIALTVLFFEKYNYWLMTALALAIAHFSEDLAGWAKWTRTHAAKVAPGAAHAIIRDPFIIAIACLVVLDIVIYASHPTTVTLLGFHVSVRDAWQDVETAIWAVLFVRAALLWRQHRKVFDSAAGFAGRRIFYWHLCPIAVSFLIPKRLSGFLWYIGSHWGEQPYRPLAAASWQWLGFSQGFHVAPWVAMLVVGLAVAGAVGVSRLTLGARAVLILATLSAAAVVLHPNQEWRFQASWIFSVWILAGAGGALLLSLLTARLRTFARVAITAAAIAGLAVAESRYGWTDMAYATASHPQPGDPSDLDFAKAYLPYVHGAGKVGFLTTLPETNFFEWTLRTNCRCEVKAYVPELQPFESREQYRTATTAWLMHVPLDVIVVIDAPSYEEADAGKTYDTLSGQIDAIKQDSRFQSVATVPVPSLKSTITIFRPRVTCRCSDGL
jgi:hypothetical protein